MKKITLGLYSLIILFFIVGCSKSEINAKYHNGQIALISKKKTSFTYQENQAYLSVSNTIKIHYETFNLDLNSQNKLIVNNHEIPLTSKKNDRSVYVLNELELLGANIKNNKLEFTVQIGADEFGNLDSFAIRNLYIKINKHEIWPDGFSKEEYLNEPYYFGSKNLTSNYRFNYQESQNFLFTIDDKLIDCRALLIDNEQEELSVITDKKSLTIVNPAYLEVDLNITENMIINDYHQLEISTKGDILHVKTYMDEMKVNNNLAFSPYAWAPGKHDLKVVVTNKSGFVMEKNLTFTLGAIKEGTTNLQYKTYDPGLAHSLPDKITNLGKEVNTVNYENQFSSIPYLNYIVNKSEDLTFQWNGYVAKERTIFMQIYNHHKQVYETVSTLFSEDDQLKTIGYELIEQQNYVLEGKIYLRVGNINLSNPNNIEASLYHLSDVQYITRSASLNKGTTLNKEAKQALNSLATYLLSQDNKNSYSIFTGDFVQTMRNAEIEWEAVMEDLFAPLLNSDIRFGVSSGNHDVGGLSENSVEGSNALDDELYYTYFSRHLGESKFANKEYYGGSYQDNRSHYDLVTLNGHEFLILYLGWGSSSKGIHVSSQDINYGKTILNQYPEKTVILATHSYMGSQNERNATGNYVFNQLVKQYANIKFVFSGHVNGTSKKIDYLDDNNDGITDRQVLQLLTNFQEEEQLYGATFIREIGLDFNHNQMVFSLFSPFMKAKEIIVTSNGNIVYNNSQFIYDFNLSNHEYGMHTNSLK